jgi:murein L,D-transpeptidase YcbB/YkuD
LAAPPALGAARDPYAAAIRATIEAGDFGAVRARRFASLTADLQRLYRARAYAPLWFRDGRPTEQEQTVADVLVEAQDEGLDPVDYDAERIATQAERWRAAAPTSPTELAAFDIALSASAMRYIADMFYGAIDPQRAGLRRPFQAKSVDLARAVTDVASGDARAILVSFAPPLLSYRYLKDALLRMRYLAAQPDLPTAPALPRIRPGDADAEVPALRRFLTTLGDLPTDTPIPMDPIQYDEALAAAVKRFQHRHGLEEDGIIGPSTLRQLRTPLGRRIMQLRLGLERLRWLPRDAPARTIIVNLPEFRLRAFDNMATAPALAMNVVIGSAAQKTETPLMHADMRYVIFRPRWNVPDSITRKEMVPAIQRNPAYFRKQNLELVATDGTALEPTPDNLDLLQTGEARLRQRPGPRNSLGLIKFVLPNRHDIYFHDTPSKGLFQRARRDFSHGCIRVADPVALAEFALAGVDHWDRARIENAMHNTDPDRKHARVTMKSPITVYLLYTTAAAFENADVTFLDDIYGHDARLMPFLMRPNATATRVGS